MLKFRVKEINPETKLIYIQRNPKDVCVSMYEYYKSCQWIKYKGNFDSFFKYTDENIKLKSHDFYKQIIHARVDEIIK